MDRAHLGVGLVAALAVLAILAIPSSAQARDYDCADFGNQAEAEEYLLPGDPYRLDADSDNVACEDLPCPCSYVPGGGEEEVTSEPPPPPPYRLSKRTARDLSKYTIRGVVRRAPRLDSPGFRTCRRLGERRVDCVFKARGHSATERTACHFRVAVSAPNRHPVARIVSHVCRTAHRRA
jgi:hypothetical protein